MAFLCFWLGFENLTFAVNAVLWSDNVDIKHYAYCDIGPPCSAQVQSKCELTLCSPVSRVQMIAFVVKPIATLIITRRLYLIISLCSVDRPNHATVQSRDYIWDPRLTVISGSMGSDRRMDVGSGDTSSSSRALLWVSEFLRSGVYGLIVPQTT